MFKDRYHAGQKLAERLEPYRAQQPLVLALPRGGVEVAAEIARSLDAELDVLVVRKLGAPHQPELAVGAIVDGRSPRAVVDRALCDSIGISPEQIEAIKQREGRELSRREAAFRGDRDPPVMRGRTVILVDDGVATGATVRAAILAIRDAEPAKLVLAVPVAPPRTAGDLSTRVDEAVFLQTPEEFLAVGQFYKDFEQTTDERVVELLEPARARRTE